MMLHILSLVRLSFIFNCSHYIFLEQNFILNNKWTIFCFKMYNFFTKFVNTLSFFFKSISIHLYFISNYFYLFYLYVSKI